MHDIDVNECERSPCPEESTCRNTRGSFTCQCASGYTRTGEECQGVKCILRISVGAILYLHCIGRH